jgi:hypothetical protein
MAAEGPFLAAIIARLPEAKVNLAAFGVAMALAWIVESPIIMILSASNALVRDRIAYLKMRRFSFTLNAAVTVVMGAMILPPVFDVVARRGIGLTSDVAAVAGRSIVFLVLWPGAIGFRRFYQGILIRDHRPQAVTWGTVIRLTTMTATGLILALAVKLPGASVGAGALGAGVIAEGLASWAMARPTVRALRAQPEAECGFGRALTRRSVVKFYSPLALTSFLSFFINPLTSFFLARGKMPLESLAVLPVIIGLAFVFRTAGLAVQEVVIACRGDEGANRRPLRRFAVRLGLIASLGMGAVVLTPLGGFWYRTVSGLTPDLAGFAILPGILLVGLPFLEAVLSFYRGTLVRSHRTNPISAAVAVQLGATTAAFVLGVLGLGWTGAVVVGPALTIGYAASNALLAAALRRP